MKHPHALPLAPLLALLPALGGCLGPAKSPEMTEEEKINLHETAATYHYDDGDLIEAQDQAVQVLEIDPENREMRRMIGWIRLRLGSTEDVLIAERFFRDLRAEGDEHDATTLGLAIARERLGTAYHEAAREYAAGTREPMDTDDPAARAAELEETAREHWTDAVSLYESTLEKGEGSTRAKNGLQRVYAQLGDFATSLRWSEAVLADAERELASWRELLTAGDLTEEEEHLFRTNESAAVELLKETHLFAASLLQGIDRPAEAAQHLDQVVEIDPSIPQVYSRRAQLHAEAEEWDLAIADLDRFLRLAEALPFEHPDVRRAFDLRADCEARLAAAGR
ncbi:MAG: tetratricopeptide repeat protein [Planctomycetota bacterium]